MKEFDPGFFLLHMIDSCRKISEQNTMPQLSGDLQTQHTGNLPKGREEKRKSGSIHAQFPADFVA